MYLFSFMLSRNLFVLREVYLHDCGVWLFSLYLFMLLAFLYDSCSTIQCDISKYTAAHNVEVTYKFVLTDFYSSSMIQIMTKALNPFLFAVFFPP